MATKQQNIDAYNIIAKWFEQYKKENPHLKPDSHVGNGEILFWLANKKLAAEKK